MTAHLLVAVAMLCWTVVELLGASAGVPPYQVVWTRYGVHLLFMLAIFGRRHGLRLVRSKRPALHILCSLLMLGMPLCFIWSVQSVGVQNTFAEFWTAPVLVIVIASLIGQKGIEWKATCAALTGYAGTLLIYRPNGQFLRLGAVSGVGMALCFALYLVMMRRLEGEFIMAKLFHTALWVFISLSAGLPFFWRTPSWRGLAAMCAIGVLGWFALAVLDRALELAPAARLAPVLFTQPLWTVMLEGLARHRLPGLRAEAGALLVAATVAFTLVRSRVPEAVSSRNLLS